MMKKAHSISLMFNMQLGVILISCLMIPLIDGQKTVPVGMIFSDKHQRVYHQLNTYVREYLSKKFPQLASSSSVYNVTEQIYRIEQHDSQLDIWTNLCTQLSQGLVAIIDDQPIDWLTSFSSTYQIPLLSLNHLDDTETHFSLTLMPNLLPALIAFIRRYRLSQIVYIYDDERGAQRLKQLMRVPTSVHGPDFNIISRYLDNPEDSYELLENIEMVTNIAQRAHVSNNSHGIPMGRYIVLDFHSFDTYRIMMDKIKHRGMTTSQYHYILLTLNAKQLDMTYFRYGGVNVTFFALPTSEKDEQQIRSWTSIDPKILIDSSIEFYLLTDLWETLFRTINQSKLVDLNTQPIPSNCNNRVVEPWSSGFLFLQNLLRTTFPGLTGHVEFSNVTGARVNYTLDIFRVTRNEMPKKIGYFQEPSIFQVADQQSNLLRAPFDNRTRLIVTIFDEPFMMLKKNRKDNLTEKTIPRGKILDPSEVEGYCVDLAYAICHERLKIPYKFLIETKYGTEIDKGVWNGMIGALVNREADLSIATLTINGAREKAVDFSKPFIDLGISIMIRKPEKQKPGVFSFMDPLSKEIWICVIISYLLVSVILFLVSRFSSYEWYFENERDYRPKNKFSFENALFFSFAAFMHQGVDLLPRSVSGRVVTGAWWFFSLILVSSYTANLAAFLTVEKLVTPIETVEDLARQTDIRYGTLKGGSTMAFFNKSTIITFKKMWNFMQQYKDDVFVSSNREGIDKVRRSKGKFAFLLESTLNEYVNEQLPCDTMRIGENIDAKGYGIATPLGSDLREAINIAVLDLTESGFLERLRQKWYYERSECTNAGTKDSKQSTALNLANVAGMFYVLIFGLGSAMLIAFLEFLLKAKIDASQMKQSVFDVMRRNLRISITGIDFDEKLHQMNYLPLEQQQQLVALANDHAAHRQERSVTVSSVYDQLKQNRYDDSFRNHTHSRNTSKL